ncbi:MAG: DNA-processing protein DprA [Spirochaetales bacterium]|nr:DNA-processing protein DprA [Spirochaetales bacterium]
MIDNSKVLLSRMRFLRANEKHLLNKMFPASEDLIKLKVCDIENIISRRLRVKNSNLEYMVTEARKACEMMADENLKAVFLGDEQYPAQLSELYNPPFSLYYRGTLPSWKNPAVSVVGTRIATGAGLDSSFSLGYSFATANCPVVSGLALGVDSAAHKGAVTASGSTIAVLGCGVDTIYPSSNRNLASSILDSGGAIVSEYLPGEPARRHHFVERNRIISGLSRAVIVVEAPGKSGALITADFALEQGRDIFFHENALKQAGEGSRVERYIFDGAPLINNAYEILADWGFPDALKYDSTVKKEMYVTSKNAGNLMAERLKDELDGAYLKFNGKYFRRGCNESPYSTNR